MYFSAAIVRRNIIGVTAGIDLTLMKLILYIT